MTKGLFFTLLLLIGTYSSYSQNKKYQKTGIASFYADKFEGRTTANGEIYYHVKRTAAHRTLPFGSIVKVTNLENNKFVVVRINDRGSFVDNRIIDLSKSAANDLGFVGKGLAKVKVEHIASIDDLPDDKPLGKKEFKNDGYYNVKYELVNPKAKGIQIGSYREDKKALKLANKIKTKYEVEVYIEVVKSKNQKLYRVIAGNSQSNSYLEKLKKNLSGEYPDCFVVQFKNLQ